MTVPVFLAQQVRLEKAKRARLQQAADCKAAASRQRAHNAERARRLRDAEESIQGSIVGELTSVQRIFAEHVVDTCLAPRRSR
jgi:hypothetical protein